VKVTAFPYSIPSVGPGADPGVQAVSPQFTISHPPGGRLPLLSAMPAVTSPAAEHHRPLAGTKLYCLVTEAHRYEQLAQGCYAALPRVGFEPATYWWQVQCYTRCTTAPPFLLTRNTSLRETMVIVRRRWGFSVIFGAVMHVQVPYLLTYLIGHLLTRPSSSVAVAYNADRMKFVVHLHLEIR